MQEPFISIICILFSLILLNFIPNEWIAVVAAMMFFLTAVLTFTFLVLILVELCDAVMRFIIAKCTTE